MTPVAPVEDSMYRGTSPAVAGGRTLMMTDAIPVATPWRWRASIPFAAACSMSSRPIRRSRCALNSSAMRLSPFGVSIRTLTPQMRETMGLKQNGGVLVSEVDRGSFADDIGLEAPQTVITGTLENLRPAIQLAWAQHSAFAGEHDFVAPVFQRLAQQCFVGAQAIKRCAVEEGVTEIQRLQQHVGGG